MTVFSYQLNQRDQPGGALFEIESSIGVSHFSIPLGDR